MGSRSPQIFDNMSEVIVTQDAEEESVDSPEATENDNSEDSSPEETDTEQTPSSEEDKDQTQEDKNAGDNLDDHPRWKERKREHAKRIEEQEERHAGEITKLREEFEEKYQPKADETSSEIPEWFGGDEKQYKAYKKDLAQQITEAREGTLKEISAKSEEEQKAVKEATEYMNEQIGEIESNKELNPEGKNIDRNKLMKFVLDNELVKLDGRWNWKAGFMMMKASVSNVKNKNIKERKIIAGATTSENRAEDKPKAFTTSEDFKNPQNRPW